MNLESFLNTQAELIASSAAIHASALTILENNKHTGLKTFDSINPSHKHELLGRFQKGTRSHVEQAVDAGWKAFQSWKRESADTSDCMAFTRRSGFG